MVNETPAAEVTAPKGKRRKWKWVLAGIILVPFAGFALYTWAALSFAYSKGDRAGYLQKFSQKGWLCKTWEGEIAMANLRERCPRSSASPSATIRWRAS